MPGQMEPGHSCCTVWTENGGYLARLGGAAVYRSATEMPSVAVSLGNTGLSCQFITGSRFLNSPQRLKPLGSMIA